jgi:predicted DNA-binding protein
MTIEFSDVQDLTKNESTCITVDLTEDMEFSIDNLEEVMLDTHRKILKEAISKHLEEVSKKKSKTSKLY